MAFYDTYHKVLNYIDLSMSGEDIPLEDLLKEIAILFQEFQGELALADEEGHKELLRLMKILHDKLEDHGKVMSERLGMSEDVMQEIANRQENFSPTQQAWLQRAKSSIESAGKGLERLEKDKSSKTSDNQQVKSNLGSKGSKKRPKRSQWFRS